MNRYGISRGVSPRETFTQVGEIAREVESLGFDMLWFVDHQLGMKDVYAAMNIAALNTQRIEIGAAVTQLQTRHPTVTANATTALDELSNGRAILGLGAGWVSVHSIGLQPNKATEIREGIKLLRRLFAGEVIDFNGVEGQLATARRQIPIYLAVSQPMMLRLAGEMCDGAILMGAADPEFCKWQLQFIYEGLEKAKRSRRASTRTNRARSATCAPGRQVKPQHSMFGNRCPLHGSGIDLNSSKRPSSIIIRIISRCMRPTNRS